MTAREQVKILLVKENLTIKELAAALSKRTNKPYSMQSLSKKLNRNSLHFDEFEEITKILGYKIELKKENTSDISL